MLLEAARLEPMEEEVIQDIIHHHHHHHLHQYPQAKVYLSSLEVEAAVAQLGQHLPGDQNWQC